MFTNTLYSSANNIRTISVFIKSIKCFSISSTRQQEGLKDNGIQDGSHEEVVLVDKDENITLIGINRPRFRNAITFETAEKISKAVSAFEADDASPIAVLYGVGGSFSAGYDIQELIGQSERGNLDFLLRHEGSVGPTRRHTRKPIICGISGFCVASGLELALMCDLRVMEETAILGFFNRRFGVPVSDGGTARLASLVGYSNALDLLETGRRVTAKEALHMGLVNRLVATGTALGQAVNLSFCIAKFPQASLEKDRSALYANAYNKKGFRAAIQTEVMTTSREVLTELKEGVHRFKKNDGKNPQEEPMRIREKPIPEWERSEIDIENKLRSKP